VTLKTDSYERLSDVPKDMMQGIERFLIEYSQEEGNRIDYGGTCSRKKRSRWLKRIASGGKTRSEASVRLRDGPTLRLRSRAG